MIITSYYIYNYFNN